MRPAIPLFMLLGASPGAAAAEETARRFRLTTPVLIIAAGLLLAGLYFLIRMLEWDLINRDTPDQDDPLDPRAPRPPDGPHSTGAGKA